MVGGSESLEFFLQLHAELGVGGEDVFATDFFKFAHGGDGLIDLLGTDVARSRSRNVSPAKEGLRTPSSGR